MRLITLYFLLACAAVALGAIPAYLYHLHETSNFSEAFYTQQWTQSGEGALGPRLFLLGQPDHDFGSVDPGKTYSHEFIIENRGDQTLEIWIEEDPEALVDTDLGPERVAIASGSSYPVTISLRAQDVAGSFEATVTIKSNDNRYNNPGFELKISGS